VASLKGRYVEGRLVDVVMQRRERSGAARSACLAAYGFTCVVCQINLKSRYADLPVEVIHVHHEEALSASEGEQESDPVATMKPVCPNCHAVIHTRTPPYSVEEVRRMVSSET
jgi:predicted HNH restriction endonuclease